MGYAEADPTSDVEGHDAAYKLAILASLAFETPVAVDDVYREGITRVTPEDMAYADELGYVIKLLAIAKAHEETIEARVHPTMVPKEHPLAAVNDVFNAIFIEGDAVGELMFYGRGAGKLPTGSAVVADIVEAAQNIRRGVDGRLGGAVREKRVLSPLEVVSSLLRARQSGGQPRRPSPDCEGLRRPRSEHRVPSFKRAGEKTRSAWCSSPTRCWRRTCRRR